MNNKVWVVVKKRYTEEESWEVICGVYDNKEEALQRVDELSWASDHEYFDHYGKDYTSEHFEGFASYSLDTGYDETRISASEYELNTPTYDSI